MSSFSVTLSEQMMSSFSVYLSEQMMSSLGVYTVRLYCAVRLLYDIMNVASGQEVTMCMSVTKANVSSCGRSVCFLSKYPSTSIRPAPNRGTVSGYLSRDFRHIT
jgi:hypothetical protein